MILSWRYALVLAALLNGAMPLMGCCDTADSAASVHVDPAAMRPCHGDDRQREAPQTGHDSLERCGGCADCAQFLGAAEATLSAAVVAPGDERSVASIATARAFVPRPTSPPRLTGPPDPNDGPRATPISLHQRLLI